MFSILLPEFARRIVAEVSRRRYLLLLPESARGIVVAEVSCR